MNAQTHHGRNMLRAGFLGALAVPLLLLIFVASATAALNSVTAVEVGVSSAALVTDSEAVTFTSYTLGAPERLVVDVDNVMPTFDERSFSLGSGFKAIRVGLYPNKTRFVFDAIDNALPSARVYKSGKEIVVDWSGTAVSEIQPAGAPSAVQQIDFDAKNGVSVMTVTLTKNCDLIPPRREGDMIRFGIKNAAIPRSLRRVIDASVFPSAVLQVTPYTTIINQTRNVMFAAQLKGPVEYNVTTEGSRLVFRTQDGPFAEAPSEDKQVTVMVDETAPLEIQAQPKTTGDIEQVFETLTEARQIGCVGNVIGAEPEPEKVYTGEPVTLVFDDAEIRKVMQLIAEVSNLNLVLSDDVKGNISLRLHDVPWDQALDLILEIKQLGTIEKGNVVRVLPLRQIEQMELDRLRAKEQIKDLAETRTEVFAVSYKDTDTVNDVIEDVLSDQGESQVIDGSKKIMVNDIPEKLDEVRELLRVLDEPVKQVMIEARIVEMRNTEGMDLGINWGLTYTNDVATKNLDSSSSFAIPGDGTYESSYAREDGVQTTTSSYESEDGNVSLSDTDTSLIGIGTSTLNDLAFGLGGSFLLPATLGTSGLGGVLNFGRVGLDSTIINLRLSALETSGQAKVVSSPKVLTLDGESAKIEQGTSIPYQSVGDQGTTTEFEDATLSLEVTPEVNPDNTVILQIKASNSSIGSTVATGAGSAPAIDTKEAETKLLLKDGETTVIGGIYVEAEYHSNSGTPFLKDIPFLGKLFESNSDSREKNELLIFITPHIVD
ncbi:MAG: type IV pilus secretin PilQ [Desulfuromonadaceae bacterium]|nr:type IV pilus secretin PilQ [Desulfuromonadaceae bacterium]